MSRRLICWMLGCVFDDVYPSFDMKCERCGKTYERSQ